MGEVTLSSKNQIVIPKEIRKALGLKPGDKLLMTLRSDKSVSVMKRPKSFHKAILGMARGLYPEGYLEEERRSWE